MSVPSFKLEDHTEFLKELRSKGFNDGVVSILNEMLESINFRFGSPEEVLLRTSVLDEVERQKNVRDMLYMHANKQLLGELVKVFKADFLPDEIGEMGHE